MVNREKCLNNYWDKYNFFLSKILNHISFNPMFVIFSVVPIYILISFEYAETVISPKKVQYGGPEISKCFILGVGILLYSAYS